MDYDLLSKLASIPKSGVDTLLALYDREIISAFEVQVILGMVKVKA